MELANKKITKATFKKFLKENAGNLLVKVTSDFNGMTDSVEQVEDTFQPAEESNSVIEHTFGIAGVWLVGSSRDYFRHYQELHADGFIYDGIKVHNSCGSFIVARKVAV